MYINSMKTLKIYVLALIESDDTIKFVRLFIYYIAQNLIIFRKNENEGRP